MNSFEDIPEDREQSFACGENGCNGTISMVDKSVKSIDAIWVCDTCDFVSRVTYE